jgi:DNA-binding LacI/PurR family transcriptional regulator
LEATNLSEPTRKRRTTITDIARDTGFSIATVSRIINKTNTYYSKKTMDFVEEAIKRLDYKPNMMARGLKNRRSYMIAYLVPKIDEFYTSIYNRIAEVAGSKGINVNILSSDYDPVKEKYHLSVIREKDYDGLIIGTGLLNSTEILEKHSAYRL